MSKAIRLKHIILVILPLLLVIFGVMYYQDIFAFFTPDKRLSGDMLKMSDQLTPRSSRDLESGEDQTFGTSPDSSSTNLTVQQPDLDGTGQVGGSASPEEDQMTQAVDTLVALLPEGDRDLGNHSEDIFTFLPSSLQNLRDPFQSLQKQAETAAQTAEQNLQSEIGKAEGSSKNVTTGETQPAERDVRYEDLMTTQQTLEQETNASRKPAQLDQLPVKSVIQYPPCVLKGLVTQGGRQKAILAIEGQSYIVNNGDRVKDWFVKEITQSAVLLTNQEGQSFRITLEGVTLDEEVNKGTKE